MDDPDFKIPNHNASDPVALTGIWWWTVLVIAVLAIPSISFIISMMMPVTGFHRLAVFICACWICVFLGMRLMKKKPQL